MQRCLIPLFHHKVWTVWLEGHLIKKSEQNVGILEMAAMKGQQERKQRNRSITVETFY